ncbi:MAG: transcriptional repressor [Muribaculum sp.]|nr:transcriptional repressor [Muribaculum sp.]
MDYRNTGNISLLMARKGVRPSAQRIAILRYLVEHPVHPTADEIYRGLKNDMPTLSLTTVYNTLRLLSEHRVIDALLIDPKNAHFDYPHHPHAHLWCCRCGKITDISIDTDLIPKALPSDFMIDKIDLYYKGTCRECAASNNG